ncbi:MAG: DNA double-strand break repair nuclease NurA [Nitrososphaeria archaeon]
MKMSYKMLEGDWFKLPHDLQHGFFEEAEKESSRLVEAIESLYNIIKGLDDIKQLIQPLPLTNKILRVGAIDSSRSPNLSERLGIRYGVYAVGSIILCGRKREYEKYVPGIFFRKQAFSENRSKYLSSLISTYVERKAALEILDKCDALILDGSFYSFVYTGYKIKKDGYYGGYEKELVERTFDYTEQLRSSGKVFSVIKRSHTRAIGGYYLLKEGDAKLVNVIDKLILSILMPERSLFDYRKLIGEYNVGIFTELAYLASKSEQRVYDAKKLLEQAENRVLEQFTKLDLPTEPFKGIRRIQVKMFGEPNVCEIEYPSCTDLNWIIDVVCGENFFNSSTNLPTILDLVDNEVNIPSKFTEEFVAEVEGRMLEKFFNDPRKRELIKTFFTALNPQKPY